ncbi:hypothetical protein PISL3812_05953 [Talaromyces islandicus]|uniref:Uncharacterized protein n=1 Tax=Talaromyces islandicus TaxID=28573 RepID=A0A0U1M042_TALIS|nr:hypothetical protein PISL3812_05953 [Talaromyces islandicus]
MGGAASPPFLYDPPSQWSFNDAMAGGFNPKAVTEQSRVPPPPRHQPDGPLVGFNRHPDSWVAPRQSTPYIPMSPYTKSRVKRTRVSQLLFRLVEIIGALCILFCVICINHTGVAVGWIIRVAPAVAILHTIYATYHLARSPASRPPASSSSYHIFAACIDAGLVPFYGFTCFIAYMEEYYNTYGWGTLFENADIQYYLVKAFFISSAVCGGLHLVSFGISVYLAVVFRQITNLPPDMNPLEDNLTARSPKRNKWSKRPKSAIPEKHMSSSTLASAYFSVKSHLDEDPMEVVPRTIPFTHTRQQSSTSVVNDHRPKSTQSHRTSQQNMPAQQAALDEQADLPNQPAETAGQKPRDSPSRPNSVVIDAPVLRPTTSNFLPTNFRWSSPAPSEGSNNWVAYPSRTPSPNGEEEIVRQPSPLQTTKGGAPSLPEIYSGAGNWLGPVPKFGRVESSVPQAEARGEYAVLEADEDHLEYSMFANKENLEEDITNYLSKPINNPLGMNPPTPQPKEDSEVPAPTSRKSSLRRAVLTDIPNLSADSQSNSKKEISLPKVKESQPKSFGSLRIWGRKSSKSAYESVKIKEDDDVSAGESSDDENREPPVLTTPKRRSKLQKTPDSKQKEADRKGRVVSNSGIDLGAGFQLGVGSSSYSDYISGLGVGRRRDVSGKVAEEGRGGVDDVEESTPEKKPPQARAAGWARFAGL